jgi:hypothetical protein
VTRQKEGSVKSWISNLSFLLVLSAAACDDTGADVDIGHDAPVEMLGSQLKDYSGTWTGYAEAYTFGDGSDQVQIVLDTGGNGSIKLGKVAPALDPALDFQVTPGFAFTVQSAQVTDNRIRFRFQGMEPYADYCAARVPGRTEREYTCAVLSATPTGCLVWDVPVECASILCSIVCSCTMEGCGVIEREGSGLSVDAALSEDGRELVGTLVGDARIVVRLKRS